MKRLFFLCLVVAVASVSADSVETTAEFALDNAFGGKEGGKVLRVIFQLTGKRLLTIAERGQEEGITVGSEHHLTAGAD